ncbi:universal stress protein [Winogradskyella echinorum]|uniref:Universal stress protein n=1 Tax=Winogradskyella echinorum TaxID=538189 RepID=A0ABR6Y1N0_9FLAO|nr:universal stress protein [Winogradskyella echinorum]MBC3846654.1 universal stress protein [Winogradskyella echinorum]MBC5751002.1 universal stress protein [Winogradskyella echinorum]
MKHILLPTDFSDNSWNAITYAIQLFKDEECTFHLFNAYTPVIYNVEYVLGYPAQFGLGDAVRSTSQNNLNKINQNINDKFGDNPNHKFETYSRFDTLIAGIKEFIETYDVDLVVMGTQGATGAKEVLFGSNTVHVFKEIKCPVLAIPSDFEFEAPHEILFPTDLEASYKHSELKILKQLVKTNHARLNTMHVSTGYELTDLQKRNKSKLKAMFKDSAYLFHDVRTMNLMNAINEFQIKHKINLLVMINNKHSFFENLFFKNTINQIGFHLNVPFLVMPSQS